MMQGCELIASLKSEYLILDFKNTLKGSPITGRAGDLACETETHPRQLEALWVQHCPVIPAMPESQAILLQIV